MSNDNFQCMLCGLSAENHEPHDTDQGMSRMASWLKASPLLDLVPVLGPSTEHLDPDADPCFDIDRALFQEIVDGIRWAGEPEDSEESFSHKASRMLAKNGE